AVIVTWNVLQHFYPYFDVVDVDWLAALDQGLEDAQRDASASDTLITLRRMIAKLDDAHGAVLPPYDITTTVPAAFARVEDKVVVVSAAEGSPLRRGDVVVGYDGEDVEASLAATGALISGSAQWRDDRLLHQAEFTEGARGTTARLDFERDGALVRVEVTREDAEVPVDTPYAPLVTLEGGVWYVDLSRVTASEFSQRIDAIASAPGVIFDLRQYPREVTSQVIRHLLRAPERDRWMFKLRVIRPDHVDMTRWEAVGWDLDPAEPHIRGKVVFLAGGGTASAAESVLGYVERMEGVEIIGETTAGANGNVAPFITPGGYTIFFTGMRVLKHDGRIHHVVGVRPTIPMTRTLAGIRAGRDELVERALEVVTRR
ncbi:MAG: hypothetical protein KC636_34875, partial [Myxococcales bacterium]|nr:hypothetical protein [Myxococcales bacterium]